MINKIFDKIVFSNISPSNKNVLWIYPIDNKHYDIRMYTSVQQDEYTSIKKWTSIGITDIAKTELSTDFWYVGFLENIPTFDLKTISNHFIDDTEECNTTTEDVPIIDRLLVNYVFDNLDRKNLYFDTRQVDPEKDLDKYYTVVIPDYYKINSIVKENYYEGDKVYQKDVLAEGEYLISSTLDFNGKQYTLLTLKFYDELTPFQITTNIVRDLEIKDFIVQERGYSIDRVMSQNAVTKALDEINKTIKNIDFSEFLELELGDKEDKTVSQKAITEAIESILPSYGIEMKNKILYVNDLGNLEWVDVDIDIPSPDNPETGSSIISENIIIKGGPLADDVLDNWPSDWIDDNNNKIIPKNTSIEDALRNLFYSVVVGTVNWSTVTWNPSIIQPSINLLTKTVELGEELTITVSANETNPVSNNTRQVSVNWNPPTNGYFYDDTWKSTQTTVEKDGSYADIELNSILLNGNAINNNYKLQVTGTHTILASLKCTVSVDAFDSHYILASDNFKNKVGDLIYIDTNKPEELTIISSNKSITITGSRYMFWGALENSVSTFTSDIIRSLLNGGKAFVGSATGIIKLNPNGVRQFVVAIPKGSGYRLTSAKNATSQNDETISLFSQTTCSVKGANGYTDVDYTVYYYTSQTPWSNGTNIAFNITIGK